MKRSLLSMAAAAVLGCVSTANADALLFPYIVSSDTVVTIASVVNKESSGDDLFLQYFVKNNVNNTTVCTEGNFVTIDTREDDLVSFEANGSFTGSVSSATGGPLFNDPALRTTYFNNNFTMGPLSKPRRAFLIVDEDDEDGEDLYGEALVLETVAGAAWGYRAYNAADDSANEPNFSARAGILSDNNDTTGEALDEDNNTDTAAVTLLPTNEWTTLFFVTPLEDDDQRDCANCSVTFNLTRDHDGDEPGVYDRDANPLPLANDIDVVCVGGVNLESALPAVVLNTVSNQGGWGFVNIDDGDRSNEQQAAVVIKLELNRVQFVSPSGMNSFNGTVNSAVWLRNADGSEGVGGFGN